MRFLFKCFHPISLNTYERKIKLTTHERTHHTKKHEPLSTLSNYYYQLKHRSSRKHNHTNKQNILKKTFERK